MIALAACGGNGDALSDKGNTDTTDHRPDPTDDKPDRPTTTVGGDTVAGLDDVQKATVRIEAKGSFVDPDVGELEGAGYGSGFVIDPSGLAVTNNHVVTGAATLNVYVDGDDEPRNAKVLGVSECSDLAVIDIDGDGYTSLSFETKPVKPGVDVYAAGYPLGDPEFTLTKGIVSKAEANGDHNWASVDHTIEHDANIQPGNSGGPLVDAAGKVVGINYAGGAAGNTEQFFAISTAEAQSVIGDLRDGKDVTSIGVNGVAVQDPDSGNTGVWVSNVASGSAADKAGLQAGDVITRMEGLTMAADGTMADYCDVLRSRESSDTISLQVARPSTNEMLEGELNGDELEYVGDLGPVDDSADAGTDDSVDDSTDDTAYVLDDTFMIGVDVPTSWTDQDTAPTSSFGVDGVAAVIASPDNEALLKGVDTPGIVVLSTPDFGTDIDALQAQYSMDEGCTLDSTSEVDDGVSTGRIVNYVDCAGTATSIHQAFLVGNGTTTIFTGIAPTDADFDAVEAAYESLDVGV
jgi:serine protease Do